MDFFVRRYLHEHLQYRFYVMPDGTSARAMEARSERENLKLDGAVIPPTTAASMVSSRQQLPTKDGPVAMHRVH